jgi:hypothetical protein
MKLLAADQMKWAEAEGKEDPVDIEVFVYLAEKNITPWTVLTGAVKVTEQDVREACEVT